MAFVIEKGIPLVASPRGRRPVEFPFTDMTEVGDTFLIPIEAGEDGELPVKAIDSWRRKVRIGAKPVQKEFGVKFTTALVPEGLRVYRTA